MKNFAEIFARIQADPAPAWIHVADPEACEARLQALDPSLPLYGLTFAVKDNIDVAGMPTTAGCPSFAYTPAVSNPVVCALEAAGALCLGKTNLDQFATGLVGTRSPYGITPNSVVPDYICGGSSAGSAYAVARHHVDFALGTDTAGSGRVPAAFNGLIGVKPTRGRLSTRGVVPACASLDCVSLFTRDLDLARRLLTVASFEDPECPWSRAVLDVVFPPGPWRVGVADPDTLFFDGDASARAAYRSAIEQWQRLGHETVFIDLAPFLEAARLLYEGPWVAERYAAVGAFLDTNPPDADPNVSAIIRKGAALPASALFEAQTKLEALRKRTIAQWARMDFLLLPTAPTCYRISDIAENPLTLNSRLGTYTNFVNLLDLAALAIPHGQLASGVPTGVTLLAPAFHDESLLDAAAVFQESAAARGRGGIQLAVLGAHLRGLPLHHQLVSRNARFVRETRTAACYRFYALASSVPAKPGIVRVEEGGGNIAVEIYELTPAAFGSFVAAIPPPLGIGTLLLEDGSSVKGFICEPAGLNGARDITEYGSWRSYLKTQ